MNAIVFKPTGEMRKAKPLEWVFDDNSFWQNGDCTETIRFYPIFTCHEVEATPEILRMLGMEGK